MKRVVMHLLNHIKHLFKYSRVDNLLLDFILIPILNSSNITNVLYDVCTLCLMEENIKILQLSFSHRQIYVIETSKIYLKTSNFYFAGILLHLVMLMNV